MDNATEELGDNLGKTKVPLKLGGQTILLSRINLNDLVELEDTVGQTAMASGTLKSERYQLWLSARRGGYQGKVDELGGLIETTEDIQDMRVALSKLEPQEINRERMWIELCEKLVDAEWDGDVQDLAVLVRISSGSDVVGPALAAGLPAKKGGQTQANMKPEPGADSSGT